MKKPICFSICYCAFLVSACGGGGSSSNEDTTPEVLDETTQVTLTNPTATFSQTSFGGFLSDSVVDGDVSTQWAIFPNVAPQTLVLETEENTPMFTAGTQLTIGLEFGFPTEHLLGCFFIGATTADRATFADGHNGADGIPGDVGDTSIWATVNVVSVATSNGAEVTIGSDNQVIVEDLDTSVATYTITAETQLVAITGIRLDVCQDPSLPFNGPGLQNTNGNFHLAEVSLSVDTL